jgi:hypothetical protein
VARWLNVDWTNSLTTAKAVRLYIVLDRTIHIPLTSPRKYKGIDNFAVRQVEPATAGTTNMKKGDY